MLFLLFKQTLQRFSTIFLTIFVPTESSHINPVNGENQLLNGTFLWLNGMVANFLRCCWSLNELMNRVQHLPDDLNISYLVQPESP